MRKSLKRIVKHRRKRSSSSSSRTYRKKHSHTKRNRKQRGGQTDLKWCNELINFYSTECNPSSDVVKAAFNALQFTNCVLLEKLLTQRDLAVGPSLANNVCSKRELNDIINYERTVMTPILLKNKGFSPDWSGLIDNKLARWLNFVRLIHNLVKEKPIYKPKPTPTPSKSQSSAPADEWGPAPVQVPGPQLPEGWNRSGPDYNPIYFNSITGHSQYDVPTMPAREFEQESAKRDVKQSAYDRLMI